MALLVSDEVRKKLIEKHGVDVKFVEAIWSTYEGILLIDDREQHRTNPPTEWFIALYPDQRPLKVVVVRDSSGTFLKTAYVANDIEQQIFKANGGEVK